MSRELLETLSNDEEHHALVNLVDGLSDMIESGRLTEGMIPEDFQWLITTLESIAPRMDPE